MGDGHAACVGEAIARSDDEVFEDVVGVKFDGEAVCGLWSGGFIGEIGGEINGDETACDLLGGSCEVFFAVVTEELGGGFVGAGNQQGAGVEAQGRQAVEPFSGAGRVKSLCPGDYVIKDALNVSNCHFNILHDKSEPACVIAKREHPQRQHTRVSQAQPRLRPETQRWIEKPS